MLSNFLNFFELWGLEYSNQPPHSVGALTSLTPRSYARVAKGEQESRAVARKPRDAAAVLFGLKFADNDTSLRKNSQASKARLLSSKHSTGAH